MIEDEIAKLDLRISHYWREIDKLEKRKIRLLNPRAPQLGKVAGASLAPLLDESLAALAERSGVSETYLRKIRNGTRNQVSELMADKILTALGMSHLLGDAIPLVRKIPIPDRPPSQYEED